MLTLLRKLRHGPLKFLGPAWVFGGTLYRCAVQKSGYSKPIEQFIGPYGPFKMHPNFSFSNYSSWGDQHNSGFTACIEACRGKSCVLDIGAHIGLVTLPAAQALAPGGRLYAFEPAAANHKFLKYHIAQNNLDNVEVVGDLAGAENIDSMDFYEDTKDNGMNSIIELRDKGDFTKTKRRQVTLDSFCAGRCLAPDVIKIDVEGAEIMVLEGTRQILQKYRPLIFLSVHPAHLAQLGQSAEDLRLLIADLGYSIADSSGAVVKEFALDEYVLTPKAEPERIKHSHA